MSGIEAYGYHLPRYSIRAKEYVAALGAFAARGVEEKIVPGWDEDEVTMGLEALQRAMALAPGPPAVVIAASSSAASPMAQTLAEAMGWEGVDAVDLRGSSHASMEALALALQLAPERRVAVAVADAPRAAPDDALEHGLGSGAAALVLGAEGPVTLASRSTEVGEDLLGPRPDDRGYLRPGPDSDAGLGALGRAARALLGEGEAKVDAVACHEWDGRTVKEALGPLLPKGLAGPGTVRFTGYTGASSPLLNLVVALGEARAGHRILVAGQGAGRATAMVLKVGARVPGVGIVVNEPREDRRYLTYSEYLRLRGLLSVPTVNRQTALGAYVPLPAYQATVAQRYRLQGQACGKCNARIFPPRAACPSCGGTTLGAVTLEPRGHLHSFTIIARGAAPTEFLDQQEAQGEYAVGLVQLDEGPRITAQITDAGPRGLEVGMPLVAVLRRLYRQEGVVRYGVKFRPAPREG